MSNKLYTAIRALQGSDEAHGQAALAEIADMARREPGECTAALLRALLDELAAGSLGTPRLLTLLSLTRAPVPECVPLCLNLLEHAEDKKRYIAAFQLGELALSRGMLAPEIIDALLARAADVQARQAHAGRSGACEHSAGA